MQQMCVIPAQGDKHRKGLKYRMGKRGAEKAPRLSEIRRDPWYKNLVACYERATPDAIALGMVWYQDANKFATELSQKYNISVETAAQVIAALSPAAKWERNKQDAAALIEAYYHRGYIGGKAVTCCTYGPNKLKALEILAGRLTLTEKQGFKTANFWQNIAKPDNNFHVTIDRHALRVLEGSDKRGAVAIKPHQYKRASIIYRTLAGEKGLIPHQLQAITWVQRLNELNGK